MPLQQVFQKQNNRDSAGNIPVQNLAVPFQLAGTPEEQKRLAEVVNRVAASRFGREVLEDAVREGYTLYLEDLGQSTLGTCSAFEKRIVLSSRQSSDSHVITLAHEARHAGQMGRGAVSGYDERYSFKTQMPHKRLMEADAVAVSIVVGEELAAAGDTGPLASAGDKYDKMVEAYEKSIHAGKSGKEAVTACMLGWYDFTARKMAYEEDHLMQPMRDGYYAMNDTGIYRPLSLRKSIDMICTFDGGSYFTEREAVLKTPERAGISSYTAAWIEKHIDACRKRLDIDVRPIVTGMPVYQVPGCMIAAREEKYGKAPNVLSGQGKEELLAAKERGAVKSAGAAVLSAAQKRSSSR